jgi:hypothetical protein
MGFAPREIGGSGCPMLDIPGVSLEELPGRIVEQRPPPA